MDTRVLAGVRAGATAIAVAAGLAFAGIASAADHMEAPLTRADLAADIADVYAWHTDQGTLVAILTFDGIKSPVKRQVGTFDPNVLYTVHLDRDGDNVSDVQIHTRFAQDSRGRWGVRVDDLPGASGPIVGPVEHNLRDGHNARVFSGLVEDPFFFDLQGFRETLSTGTLSFRGDRDTFAGKNATAIVLEMDLAAALAGAPNVHLWATTARRGGTP